MNFLATYPSDVIDFQWALVHPMLKRTGKLGRPQPFDWRRVFNACAYVLNTGCPWRSLPKDAYPSWPGVYKHFRRGSKLGLFEGITMALNREIRRVPERNPTPSPPIADAHSLKSRHGGEEIGFDGHQKVCGRKNPLLIDTLGLLWGVRTHAHLHQRQAHLAAIGGYHTQTPPARNYQRLLDPPDQRIVNWREGQRADVVACFAKRLCRNDAQRICAFAKRGKGTIPFRRDCSLQTGLQESQNGWEVE